MFFPGLLDEGLGVSQLPRHAKVLFALRVAPLVVVHAVLAIHVDGRCYLLQCVGAVVALG